MADEVEIELELGDYDLEFDAVPVEANDALDYNEDENREQDDKEGQGGPGDSLRKPGEAIALAREMSRDRTYVGVGYCLKVTRGYYGVPAKFLSAEEAWNQTDHKVRVNSGSQVPRGVPVYWTNGRYGHIAISIGGGMCLSTDWAEPGRIDVARIDDITRRWGQNLQGYAWDINDVIVWRPNEPREAIKVSMLKPGKRNDEVVKLKRALEAKGYEHDFNDGKYFGKRLQKAYRKYQLRLGYNGDAADGIPGWQSLRKLGFKISK